MTKIREGAVVIVERLPNNNWRDEDLQAVGYTYTEGQWTRHDSVLVDISYLIVAGAIESLTEVAASFGGVEEARLEIDLDEEYGSFGIRVAVSGTRPANNAELLRIKMQQERTTQAKKDQRARRAKLKTDEVAVFIKEHPELDVRPK